MFDIDTLLENFSFKDLLKEEKRKPSSRSQIVINAKPKKISKDEYMTRGEAKKLLSDIDKRSREEAGKIGSQRMTDDEYKKSINEPDKKITDPKDDDLVVKTDAEEKEDRKGNYSSVPMAVASIRRLRKAALNLAKAAGGMDPVSGNDITEAQRKILFNKYRLELKSIMDKEQASKNTALKLSGTTFWSKLKEFANDSDIPDKKPRDWEGEYQGGEELDKKNYKEYKPDEATEYVRDILDILRTSTIAKKYNDISQVISTMEKGIIDDLASGGTGKKEYFTNIANKLASGDERNKEAYERELKGHEDLYGNNADVKERQRTAQFDKEEKEYRDKTKNLDAIIAKHYGAIKDDVEEIKPEREEKKLKKYQTAGVGATGQSKMANMGSKNYKITEFSKTKPYHLPNGDIIKGANALVRHWIAMGIPKEGQIEVVSGRNNGIGTNGKPILFIKFPQKDGGESGFYAIPKNDLSDASRGGILKVEEFKGYVKDLSGSTASKRALKAGEITQEEFDKWKKFRDDLANSSVETK